MPYIKVHSDGKWRVYKKDSEGKPTGDALGTHDSEDEANRQIAAIYANESRKTLKAIDRNDEELVTEGYIVLWGSPDQRDLEGLGSRQKNADGSIGQYFTPETCFDSPYTQSAVLHVDWEHGQDPDEIGNDKHEVIGRIDWKSAKVDDVGLIVNRVLNRRHRYMKWLEMLIEEGLVGSSSESSRVKVADDGRILEWPLYRDTLSVQPMEHRQMSEGAVRAMKALHLIPDDESDSKEAEARAQPASQKSSQVPTQVQKKGNPMSKQEEMLRTLVPGLTDEQVKALEMLQSLQSTPPPKQDPPEPAKAVQIPDPEVPHQTRPPYSFEPKPQVPGEPVSDDQQKAIHAAYVLRYGEEQAEKAIIFQDAIGKNYQQIILDQNRLFNRYIREGDSRLDREERKALSQQIFPLEYILSFVKEGMDIASIKTTMIEAQGDLGGYAVPPNQQTEIITRLPGLTVVRGAGATVVTLASGNSIDLPKYTGTDSAQRYVGALRGTWGNETKTPTAKNATLGLAAVPANLYTYKVPISQTLVDDAVNLVSLLLGDIVDTLAIDEDEAFLTGDGAGKPWGILPGGANAFSLTEVVSGSASVLTTTGVKALKRGLAAQYRKNGVFIANSDTFGLIERFQSTTGEWIFPDLTDNETLMNRRTFESEVMPDVAAGAFPILFCDMRGYYIVERLGLTIARFQDSNTGVNVVEYHVRRRLGGRLVKPWLFSVQKVAAS